MNSKDSKAPPPRPDAAGTGSPSPEPAPPPPSGSKPKAPGAPSAKKKRIPPWLRIVFRILRVIAIPVLCIAAMVAGVMIGYGYVGGREYTDVWDLETWKHLFELVFAE